MAPLRPDWPAYLPSPEALQMATEALGRHYSLDETVLEPVVVSEAIQLAYLLSAYGLVPTQPQTAAARYAGPRARLYDDANALELTSA